MAKTRQVTMDVILRFISSSVLAEFKKRSILRPMLRCGSRMLTMSDPLHPTDGIRLLLERESVADDQQSATYLASIYTVTSRLCYSVTLTLDGTADLASTSEERASDDDQTTLLKLSKSIARAAKRKLAEQLPPWPPRILRWRGPRS